MYQAKSAGVQCLSLKAPQSFPQRDTRTGGQSRSAAVLGITQQRVADAGHVNPDLMRAAGFEIHLQKRVSPKTFQHTIAGH